MLKRTIIAGKALLVAASLSSCSSAPETKQFESPHKWFKLTYPVSWQVETEDNINTFTKENEPDWAFQVSAFKATQDTIPDFDLNKKLGYALKKHPSAQVVTLPN